MLKEKLVDVVHPLLMQLAEAKSRATTCDHGDPSPTTELFEKMERAVRFMEDVSLRLERWEREVQDSVGDITKHLNDMLEDDGNRGEGFQRKLQTVDQKVADLKAHMTPPLVLPVVESCSTLPPHLMRVRPSLPVAPNVGQRYENLSPVVQKCLLSLCIFPKDAVIKKRLLIYWWIGEGLATPTSCWTAQEDGEDLFKVLVNEGFITPIYRYHSSATDSCRVPLLIRDELVHIAVTYQSFRLHRFGQPIGSIAAPSSGCLLVDDTERDQNSDPELELELQSVPLTTCFNVNRHYLKFERDEFSLMKDIAVLQLGRWQSSARHHVEVDNTEFLESNLGSFNTLRYLSLQGISRIKELPASTGELTNLMILDLRDCNNLERLPVEITMLCRLTHLDVSGCYFLDHMPKGLGSLCELQVLKGFVVASSTSRNPCRLGDLSGLKRLRKLSIRIGRDSLVADGELNELEILTALRCLTISWGAGLSSSSHLDVSPPSSLEKLDLRCFPGSTAPEWLNPILLWKLQKLYIRGGRLCGFRVRNVTPRWPGLNVLRLRFLNALDMEESELLQVFPALVFFEIHECMKMKSTTREGFQHKLLTVDQKVSDLKAHKTPPLVLHPVEESSSSTLPPHLMTPSLPDVATNVVQRYKNLSPVLQKCLLSLCIFPKDALIKKRLLIYWWIGEGLATPTSHRTAQEDGEDLFKVLVNEGFITPIHRDHSSATNSCRVPPLILDELVRLAVTNQGFRPIGSLAAPSSMCLLVDGNERDPELELLSGPLTTCFNVNRHYLKFERGEFSLMKNIVVLQLGRWLSSARHPVEVDNTEFLEHSLGSFKTLRYLSLQGISRIKELPASTGELTNLMILDLRECNKLERLPVEITMLCRLTHLDVSGCYFLDHIPKGLGSLRELQVLKGFVIASSTSCNPCRLGDLSRLEKLRKLSIRIGRHSLVAGTELNQLEMFTALRSLTITWAAELSSSSHQGHLDVSLPSCLEKLDLRCFPESTAPGWLNPIMLSKLQKLYIRGGRLCGFRVRNVTPTWWGLKVLRLRFLNALDMEESELLKVFPALVFLEIHECKKMKFTALDFNRYKQKIFGKEHYYSSQILTPKPRPK